MPEAVTTQHETLWIGVNRSAMVRVPYVVSSPEIADPVQPIDATNLASDIKVYIPGIKDYSGDLVWEANSQYYRPGELRDLLAMDGFHVWAERRMPMVGMRVAVEGEASVSLSAADPDGVQRVTIRIAPSAPMAVEEWSPDMSDGYLVRIRTDSETHMDVVRVDVAYGGRSFVQTSSRTSRRQGAANIPHEWDWNGGVGPFGCFYAAFNIDDYTAGTETEEPVCTEAGRLAYRLDPYDLGRSLAGTVLVGTYNVMLVIPTVYWRVTSNDLYLSDRARFNTMSGMVPYAHTATLPGGGTKVYPYIGIGVYEAYSDGTRLYSTQGHRPTASLAPDRYKELADAMTPAAGCGFQQWTLNQYTLYKAMSYAVMGTKNAQWCLGEGPSNNNPQSSVGGLADKAGPYADATADYSKLFIENPWGSIAAYIGDAMTEDYVVKAGQTLGGAVLGGQESIGVSVLEVQRVKRWIARSSNASVGWDLPTSGVADENHNDPATCGDTVNVNTGRMCMSVGGTRINYHENGLGWLRCNAALTSTSGYTGARLSYFIDDYAVGLTDDAPAVLMSVPLTLSMGQSTPDEDEEPAEEPAEEPEESEEEPEEDMR